MQPNWQEPIEALFLRVLLCVTILEMHVKGRRLQSQRRTCVHREILAYDQYRLCREIQYPARKNNVVK